MTAKLSRTDLCALAEQKIQVAEQLLEQLKDFHAVTGVCRLERKISQEIKFLMKASK